MKLFLETKYDLIHSKDVIKIIFSKGYETVILFLKNNKITLCLSSQIGCKFNCSYCLTGKLGFIRDLNYDEIINQYLIAKEELKEKEITSIVYMGMGEPLDNLDNVIKSINILTENYKVPLRKITVSTCGIPSAIIELNQKTKVKIALSLNAISEELRSYLMPVNKKYSIKEIISALKEIKTSKHKPVMLEYIMIKDVNDSLDEISKIPDIFKGIKIYVNLIPFNCHHKSDFKPSDFEKIVKFKDFLLSKKIKTFIRSNIGNDISAACGTLGSSNFSK